MNKFNNDLLSKLLYKELEVEDQKKRIDVLEKSTKKIIDSKNMFINKIYELFLTYKIDNNLNLLNIKLATKNNNKSKIDEIQIFTRRDKKQDGNDNGGGYGIFTIKYTDIENITYEFNIVVSRYKLYPYIMIKKNGNVFKKYNIIKEYKSFNYTKLETVGSIDNYISLFVKDEILRIGMIIIGYFFLIEYLQYAHESLYIKHLFKRENVKTLNIIFNYNIDDLLKPNDVEYF